MNIAADRLKAMAMMVIASVGISFGGLIIRSMEAADTWQINFYRAFFMILAVVLVMLVRYRRITAAQFKVIGTSGVVGAVMVAVAGMAFLQAITTTTVANALFTLSGIPFFTAAMAWLFLREALPRATVITMVIAAFGVMIMVGGGIEAGSWYGNAMALVTALCFSAYATIIRRSRGVDMMPVLILSSILIIAVAVAVKDDDLAIPLHDIFLCFLLGGVLSGSGNAMFIWAARHLAAAELTLFMLLEFALGPIWVWIFINEVPRAMTLVGGGIVIGAVAARTLLERKR